MRRSMRAAAVAAASFVAYQKGLRPWQERWGASDDEVDAALSGDDLTPDPASQVTRAITIEARPEDVWPWIVQLGAERAGFYSYDWLERAFGADIRNVTELRPEWQRRAAGDFVPATQPGYLGVFPEPLGWRVSMVDPGRAMVLENWGAFVLQPTDDGKTRFIIRSTIAEGRVPVWSAALNMLAFQVPHFIMERRMMLQIKALAEKGTPS
jgi:hypothetical protein